MNAIFVPISWILAIVDFEAPQAPRRSQYQVRIVNPQGRQKGLRLADTWDVAVSLRDDIVRLIETEGIEAWSAHQPITSSFFASPS